MDDMFSLEPIIEYRMTGPEARAYKIALLWLAMSRKAFPDYIHTGGIPKKGDPRKCQVFRHCYKFNRETTGLLSDGDVKLFIQAQLDILKAIDLGGHHPRVDSGCLAGDKAWVRWKIWKRKYDAVTKRTLTTSVGLDVAPEAEVDRDLKRSHTFLMSRFDGTPCEDQFKMLARDVERWVSLGKVSAVYAVLSPWATKYCKFTTDLTTCHRAITDSVRTKFRTLFCHEFI